ncbi:MAG: ABC transporter substrate-binding protein [Methanosarcinaceae archaeon]|jgi:NitT/TauT family transport system substrate-binding protein|nr:ABC transporter substrate-binding protein [Methanosarcinaceae archaeon]NKQ38030.1 ABC transporter substrate-binding protein [Methanosarcinales archaeon]
MKNNKNKWKIFSVALSLILIIVLTSGCLTADQEEQPHQQQETIPDQEEQPQTPELIPKLTIIGPPGPPSIPLVYMVENDRLSHIAEETELVIWKNLDQLRAIIAGQEGDFAIMPSNIAAMFYNKEMDIQLIDISVWSVFDILSSDPTVESMEDLKGDRIAIPFEGGVPDILFRYISERQGIDITKDMEIYYVTNPAHSARMLIEGKVDHALSLEPLTTTVLLKEEGRFHRVIDLSEEWQNVVGGEVRTPIAGTVALPSMQKNPEAIREFQKEFELAIAWMIENPDEAGIISEKRLGFNPTAVSKSIANTEWEFVTARDARDDLEAFFGIMYNFSPKTVGGKMPDDGFYHEGF